MNMHWRALRWGGLVAAAASVLTACSAGAPLQAPAIDGMQVGAPLYIDREYSVAGLPQELVGATYIQTANADKQATDYPFLTFDIDRDALVYVAYDERLPSPAWLDSFAETGWRLTSSTGDAYRILVRAYPEGKVALGPNRGTTGSNMYVVILTPTAGQQRQT
jgi:hypothetical protein